MGLLDGVLQQVTGDGLEGLAGRVGLTPEQVQMALHALSRAAPQRGDTAHRAAEDCDLPLGSLQQILGQVGESNLGPIAGALGGSGLGGVLGGLGDMLGGGRSR